MLQIDVKKMGIDLLTTSGHKLYGPKGIGFLYKKNDVQLQPLQYGGKQERTIRPGTENLIGAVGFQTASNIAMENKEENVKKYTSYKNAFIEKLKKKEEEFKKNRNIDLTIQTIIKISF